MTYDLVPPEDPVLHQPATEVLGFDYLIQEIVAQLEDTLSAIPHAAGLAAPQVGIPLRIAVLKTQEMPTLINPRIISTSKDARKKTEGCLSYPGRRFRVQRYNSVTITYLDEFGRRHTRECHGTQAQLVQHEIDHLDGKTIAD